MGYKVNKTNMARLLEVKTRYEKTNNIMLSMENFLMLLLDIYEKDYSRIANRQANKIAKTLVEFYTNKGEKK